MFPIRYPYYDDMPDDMILDLSYWQVKLDAEDQEEYWNNHHMGLEGPDTVINMPQIPQVLNHFQPAQWDDGDDWGEGQIVGPLINYEEGQMLGPLGSFTVSGILPERG